MNPGRARIWRSPRTAGEPPNRQKPGPGRAQELQLSEDWIVVTLSAGAGGQTVHTVTHSGDSEGLPITK